MKQTPEKIWLKEDSEDPDYIVWGNDQPANDCDGIEYIRADLVQRHLTSAMHPDGEDQCISSGMCEMEGDCKTKECYISRRR